MSKIILKTNNLHKEYGRITALNQVNLQINKGEVFGLLGPNGSGKTTALGIILGVTNASSGSYEWFGLNGSNEHRKNIGAILEKPNFYTNYSAERNLKITCLIKGASLKRIPEVLRQVNLYDRRNDPFKTYSLGMKQRLAIAAALLADPDVLILDEPTNGLDPQGISDMRSLIIEISRSGKTIILASHLLDEVQKVCTHFGILRKGTLIHSGRVDSDLSDNVHVEIGSKDLIKLEEIIKTFPGYITHKPIKDALEVKINSGATAFELNQFVLNKEVVVNHLVTNKKTLEQQFLEILENGNA